MKIPLILWGKNPPSHSITCIARCYNNSRIMTGSIEGQIGCWDVIYDQPHDTYSIQPFCIIFAHSCSIDDICLLSNLRMGILSGLVSLSNSGELCLWNSENGCCLNTTLVNSKFNKIYAIYGHNADVRRQSLIICYGTHPEMQIFDPFSLEMLFTLKQNCPWPNFISTVCFFPASNNLMAVTYSGVIKTWDMCEAFRRSSKFSVIKDSYQYNLALQPDCIVRQIVPNLTSNKHFLLIYDSTKIVRLISTPVQLQQSWAGGDFLENNMVILWDKSGTCYLFAISNDEYTFRGCRSVFESPLLYAIFHTDRRETGLSVTMLNKSRPNMNFSVIFQGCIGGRITFWRLPLLEDLNKHVSLWCDQIHEMCEIFDEEGFGEDYPKILDDHVVHMEATYVTGLSDTFNKSQPPNIINKIDNTDKNPVCCSIFLTETGFIAAGRTNGNITLIPALHALCFEFLRSDATTTTITDTDYEESEYCNLYGHTKKITYLFYPYDENDHYQPQHLLSGSADFTVRLWNIITLTQLACFCYHAGVITKILPVPVNSSSVIGSSIVTIGSDHTVNVINIDSGKHIVQANSNNSPVQIVKWRMDEDLMLLGCGDGVIYIWQLSTGKLDRCISGGLALEILEEFYDITEVTHSPSISSSSMNVNSNDKTRSSERKISRVASSIAMKFGKNQNSGKNDQMHQLRFHRHHLHSNHHINLLSLKKSKLKRRSFKMKSFSSINKLTHKSERSLKDAEAKNISNSGIIHSTSSKPTVSRSDSRTFDKATTTLNMASQPLTNLQSSSTVGLNYSNSELNDDYFANRVDNSLIENVSHTTNQYLPFNIISARTSYHNDDIHVLLFDPDAIIRTINYLEETLKSIKNLRVGYLKKSPIAASGSAEEVQSQTRPVSAINLSVNYPSISHNISSAGNDSDQPTDSLKNSRMSSCFKYLGLAVAPPNNICDYSKYLTKHAYYQSKMIRQTIKILISALSAWGLDKKLDKMCEERLLLNYPQKAFCFGLISHGKLVAQLPLPHSSTDLAGATINTSSEEPPAAPTEPSSSGSDDIQQSVIRHWNSSKTMLTQHIVTIVSIANAILGAESSFVMDYIFSSSNIDMLRTVQTQLNLNQSSIDGRNEFAGVESSQVCAIGNISSLVPGEATTATSNLSICEKSRFQKKTISSDSSDLITTIKSYWSSLANFYCFTINTRSFECKQFHFRGVILHELIRHWLSFNSNIREASRSILLSELTRLGIKYVSNLILAWSYFLPDNISFYDNMYTSGTSDQIPISYPGIQNSLVIESGGSYGYWPTPVHHRATLALYMISFILCELYVSQNNSTFNLRSISDVLPESKLHTITRLLMESITLGPNQKVHYPTPSKRSSIWLIGRGFQLFSQHIDLTKLLATLLDVSVTLEIIMKYHSSKQPRASKIEYTKALDTWSATQETLNTIAAHNPVKLLSSVEADIIRNVSNSNLLSNISVSSTTALHMYNVYVNSYNKKISQQQQQTPAGLPNNYLNDFSVSTETNTLNVLNIGAIFKKQLFKMMNHIFDVCYTEICPYLIEIFDIVLQCLSPKVFKDKPTELYQRSKMFSCPMVNYNEAMKKLAVGTTQGKIGLYDVRSLKLTVFPAHDSEISFVSFSPDGKYLVSFSKVDCNLKTWQSQFSIIGLINNPFKQHNNYLITIPEGNNKLLECVPSFEWSDSRHITVRIDQNQYSFVV